MTHVHCAYECLLPAQFAWNGAGFSTAPPTHGTPHTRTHSHARSCRFVTGKDWPRLYKISVQRMELEGDELAAAVAKARKSCIIRRTVALG